MRTRARRWTREGHALLRHPREAGIPRSGAHAQQWTRKLKLSVIQRGTQYPVESPCQGQSSTTSLPFSSQQGDSRAKRENDSVISAPLSLPRRNQPGDSSVAALPLNDVRESECAAGCGRIVDAEAHHLRHSEAAGRGIPYGGAERYVIVTCTNQRWDSSVAMLPLNDVQE